MLSRVSLRCSLCILALAGVCQAQSQYGSVTGSVTDPSLAKVSGVAIRATNEASNLGFSTETRESGEYLIGGLIPGVYTVTATKAGFKDLRLTGIVVPAGNVARADMQLTLGATTESVTVSAPGVQLNTESGTVAPSALAQYLEMPATIMPSG
ncbi:MAG: carboxypeptidase regulatory-like domain-containing protein [Acidobacteria bacterium]|nr:carboxypeptidase regulatory-like domain-containing protein [Acidobacteriota bacterium]